VYRRGVTWFIRGVILGENVEIGWRRNGEENGREIGERRAPRRGDAVLAQSCAQRSSNSGETANGDGIGPPRRRWRRLAPGTGGITMAASASTQRRGGERRHAYARYPPRTRHAARIRWRLTLSGACAGAGYSACCAKTTGLVDVHDMAGLRVCGRGGSPTVWLAVVRLAHRFGNGRFAGLRAAEYFTLRLFSRTA